MWAKERALAVCIGLGLYISGCAPGGSSPTELPATVNISNPQYDDAPVDWELYQKLWLNEYAVADPSEPVLRRYQEQVAVSFLDRVSSDWAKHNQCGTCHTNVPYLMVRPLIDAEKIRGADTTKLVRSEIMSFVGKNKEHPDKSFYAAPAAAAFAMNDALSGRGMSEDTRYLYDFIWETQDEDGGWAYPLKGMLPFLERDQKYVGYLVALGTGYLPETYKAMPEPKAGIAKMLDNIRRSEPDKLHDKAVLLWASKRTQDLLSISKRRQYAKELRRVQNADGGWTLAKLGHWPRHDGAPNDPDGPSDGYGTAIVTLALCSSEHGSVDKPAVKRGVDWLKVNQRSSGRWYSRSTYSDRFKGYISNMATAYAVLAIKTCKS